MNASHRSGLRATSLRGMALTALTAAAVVGGGRQGMAAAVDDAVWNPGTGHWYAYVTADLPSGWNTCRDAAAAAGGHLATITSIEEQTWIANNLALSGRPAAWLGATDAAAEGTWQWTGGEAWSFSNWSASEPSDTAGTENWLAIAPDGTWSDEASIQTMWGYIVEWDSDPSPQPPGAPTNLVAVYGTGMGVRLTWNDNSSNETDFVIERMPAGFAYSVRKTVDQDAATWTDFALFPSATYTYRVAAVNAAGISAYSNEVSITTAAGEALPAPPNAPSALAATPNAAPAIDLTWNDNSEDETLFYLERAEGGAPFDRSGTFPAGTAAFTDDDVHPGWPYTYRIRALGLQGPSAFSNTVAASVPATLGVSMQTGTLKHSPSDGRDTVVLAASLTLAEPAPGEALDPVANGLAVQYGPVGAPIARHIAANDPGWKVKLRHGTPVKASWKSPKGEFPKLAVTVDIATGRITLSAKRADFAADQTANVRLLVACGARCGGTTAAWTPVKPGVLQLK